MKSGKYQFRLLSMAVAVLSLPTIVYSFGRLDSRNGDECRAQVNAVYDEVAARMRANGNLGGIAEMEVSGRAIHLRECELMDRQAREALMQNAYQRLSQAIESLREKRTITAQERDVVASDYKEILAFPPAPYREAYLRLHTQYLRYQSLELHTTRVYRCTDPSGQVEVSQRPCATGATQSEMVVEPVRALTSAAQCKEFEARIEQAKAMHDDAVTGLLSKSADGVVRNHADWRALEERRQTSLSEWQWQRDSAAAAGCGVEPIISKSAPGPATPAVDSTAAPPLDQQIVTTAPPWQSRPSLSRLSDERVMMVGHESEGDGTTRKISRIWDPAGETWSSASSLSRHDTRLGDTIQLPSGRVIHVGIDNERTLICEAWGSAGSSWSECGSIPLQYISQWPIQLGLLPDGRAYAIANMHEILVFDEARGHWSAWSVEWDTAGRSYGAPIGAEPPLARILDEANGKWIEINEGAARFYGNYIGIDGPSLLWDRNAEEWAYVFRQHKMGHDAQFLPDGCAISTNPLALYDPHSGKVTPLVDPGIGFDTYRAEMVVLSDGTVVIAGAQGGRERGGAIFHRKATCSGFKTHTDGSPVTGGPVADNKIMNALGQEPVPQLHWHDRVWLALMGHRWLMLAIFAPLLGYLSLRRMGIRRAQIGPSWVLRLLVYGLFVIFVAPAIWSYVRFERVVASQACEEDPKVCLGPSAGILGARKLIKADESGESFIPCRMVGVWSSRRDNLMHRIELKDDGTYVMEPNDAGFGSPNGYTGYWAVQDRKVVWRHNQGGNELDVNPIALEDDTRFTLIESNGSHTRYELIRAVPSRRCRY